MVWPDHSPDLNAIMHFWNTHFIQGSIDGMPRYCTDVLGVWRWHTFFLDSFVFNGSYFVLVLVFNSIVYWKYYSYRPLTNNEQTSNCTTILKTTSVNELVIGLGANEKKYLFDQVFPEQISQDEVYQVVVSPLIDFCISGYNCTVFAYGQTGTGKTYTMIGDASDVIFNADKVIYNRI